MRFEGSDTYIATDDLKLAVNAALAMRPRENNKPSPIRRPAAFLLVGRRMRFSRGWRKRVVAADIYGILPPPVAAIRLTFMR